ncbi:unnamed protein product [Tuber aestivum]|uniref:tRNA(His) guanylyltransferase n=1 Tax=Tuber aestivum TaxID=59557 RepID=A0A292PW06_9PEZI|nr:unnamed protein product [Tuber aestivum]
MSLTIRCHLAISRSNRIPALPITLTHRMTHTTTSTSTTTTRQSGTEAAPPSPPTATAGDQRSNNHYHNTPPRLSPAGAKMANSKYEYTRAFENPRYLLPNTYVILRLDGRSFTNFSASQKFQKPNDSRALDLMNASAAATLKAIPEILIAYGASDEFSFLLSRECALFNRREDKLVSTVVSTFTAWYVFLWSRHFTEEGEELQTPPSFDCRAVCYPSVGNIRDYFAWRQVDVHINNLYNTAFWALVIKGGVAGKEAEVELRGTLAADKNELLFSRFGINYNNEPVMYRKGSVVYRDYRTPEDEDAEGAEPSASVKPPKQRKQKEGERGTTAIQERKLKTPREEVGRRAGKARIVTEHVDIIGDAFWEKRPWLLGSGN